MLRPPVQWAPPHTTTGSSSQQGDGVNATATATSSSTSPPASKQKEEEEAIAAVAGAVSATSRTDPPFQIWLFPPEQDRHITRKIQASGVYEPDETIFAQLAVASKGINKGSDGGGSTYMYGANNTGSGAGTCTGGGAMDIGANVGFHSLHMAALGMDVISLEPSPDTASLLRRSARANGFDFDPLQAQQQQQQQQQQQDSSAGISSSRGSVRVVQAAAAATPGLGKLLRHPHSPGMTILQRTRGEEDASDSDSASDALPFGVDNVVQDGIELVRPDAILSEAMLGGGTVPNEDEDSELCLLKVDAEGYELRALKGVDLDRFPFPYITFEFFPELLVKAGKTDPLELLLYVYSFGYVCGKDPTSVHDGNNLMKKPYDVQVWYQNTVVPAHQSSSAYHLNMFCAKKNI